MVGIGKLMSKSIVKKKNFSGSFKNTVFFSTINLDIELEERYESRQCLGIHVSARR